MFILILRDIRDLFFCMKNQKLINIKVNRLAIIKTIIIENREIVRVL